MKEENQNTEVQLFSSLNEYEIDQVCFILTENNIPFIRKSDGSGSYMNLYMGQSIQEKRVFVNEEDYEKSLELISSFIPNEIEEKDENEKEEEEEQEMDRSSNKYTLIRRGLGFLILGMPILAIIVVIIMSFLHK